MFGNLAVILMVLCVVIVGLAAAFAGVYFLDRAVDQGDATTDHNPAE
jgi:type IV secretory pathway VirB2 component (pilin)